MRGTKIIHHHIDVEAGDIRARPSEYNQAMAPRWIIPVCLAIFSVIAAAIWVYLDQTQFFREENLVLSGLADLRSAAKALNAPSPPSINNPVPEKVSVRPSRPKVADSLQPSLLDSLPVIADRIDEKSVALRANLEGALLVRYTKAMTDLRAGRAHSALNAFERILAKSPDNTAALNGRAQALVALHRTTEAADMYKRLVRLAPDDASIRYNFGVLLCRDSRFGPATEQFHEAVMLDPANAPAWFNLASLTQRDGKLSEAHDAWKRFTALQPDNASGWFQLGTVEMDLDAYESAIFCFTYALALTPEDLGAHLNLALAYAAAGDPDNAFSTTIRADQLFPCNPAIQQLNQELTEVFPHSTTTKH